MPSNDREFCARSAHHLREEYLPRIARALEVLPPRDLWWRPHDGANAVGNLLVHLEANVRQWILSGIDGQPESRDRNAEFRARDGDAADELFRRLDATVRSACDVIEGLDSDALAAPLEVQSFQTTALAGIYHVVEHFAWHTGQIVWAAKQRAGSDHGIHFYDDDALARYGRPDDDNG